MNYRKRKSSRIHMLCDDWVLFRLRPKNLSPVCSGTAFLFVQCNQSENQFKENLNTSNTTKEAKTDLEGKNVSASFCVCPVDTKTRPKASVTTYRGGQFAVFTKNVNFSRLPKVVLKRKTPLRNTKNVSTKSVSLVPGIGSLGTKWMMQLGS